MLPSNFNRNGNNIKFWGIQNTVPNDGSANHIDMLIEDLSSDRLCWLAGQGGGMPGGSAYYGGGVTTAPAGALVGPLAPTAADQTGYWYGSQVSEWHMLEFYHKAETTPGTSGDGVFQSWVDGVQINGWANLNYNISGWAGQMIGQSFQFIPYYGGGGSDAPANEYWCIGRTQVAYA